MNKVAVEYQDEEADEVKEEQMMEDERFCLSAGIIKGHNFNVNFFHSQQHCYFLRKCGQSNSNSTV